jgi:hypothetical protein
METASNVLGYSPWVAAITVFIATGSILRALAVLTLLSITLSLPAIFLGHAARRRIRKNEGPLVSRRPASSGLALGYLGLATGLVFFFWFPYGDPLGGRAANEASAVGSLRSIYRAADNYKSAHPMIGFPQSLRISCYPERRLEQTGESTSRLPVGKSLDIDSRTSLRKAGTVASTLTWSSQTRQAKGERGHGTSSSIKVELFDSPSKLRRMLKVKCFSEQNQETRARH